MARSRAVVRAAARHELAEVGLGGFTIDGVASRAGVGRSTIYRHWGDRMTLVRDAVGSSSLPPPPEPTRGDTLGRVRELAHHLVDAMATPPPPTTKVTGPLRHQHLIQGEDDDFLDSVTSVLPKVSIPSPSMLHFRGGRQGISRDAYPDLEDFHDDLTAAYRDEIADMAATVRLCRGNFKSAWVAQGGYDPVAEILFQEMDVDGFFLEYDDERSGDFASLRHMPTGSGPVVSRRWRWRVPWRRR